MHLLLAADAAPSLIRCRNAFAAPYLTPCPITLQLIPPRAMRGCRIPPARYCVFLSFSDFHPISPVHGKYMHADCPTCCLNNSPRASRKTSPFVRSLIGRAARRSSARVQLRGYPASRRARVATPTAFAYADAGLNAG